MIHESFVSITSVFLLQNSQAFDQSRSTHAAVVAALEHEDLNRIVIVDRRPLDLQHQYLPDVVLGRHSPFVRHIFLQLQIHEELRIGLAVHEVLGDDVVGSVGEAFVRDCLDFEREVEVAQVFEGDRRHADLVLLGWDLDDRRVLVGLVEVLDAKDLRDLALRVNGQRHGLQAFKLNLQKPFNHIVFPYRRDLDRDLNLCSLFLSDFEPHLLEVLKALVAPDREDILIQVVELRIVALGDDSEHEGIGAVILDDLILEANRDIKFLD